MYVLFFNRALEQEYQERLRSTETKLETEREKQSSQLATFRQTSEQVAELQQQVALLKEKLSQSEGVRLENTFNVVS